jgi:hypothetical protein
MGKCSEATSIDIASGSGEEKTRVSAAFQLDFSGPQTSCGFPGCLLDSYHDGEHQFAALKTQFPLPQQYNRTCSECGLRFAVMIEGLGEIFRTCGSPECLLSFSRKHAETIPVSCTCLQRPYPHELSVHRAVKFESRKLEWPWSLRFAPEMEA